MGNSCSPGCRFDGAFLCCPFSHEMSWIRSGTELSQFLRVFLPTRVKWAISSSNSRSAEKLKGLVRTVTESRPVAVCC